MKIINCIQGSPEWRQARCGVVTASRFADLMTQPRSKADRENGTLSRVADAYLNELIGERISGKPAEVVNSKILEHGTLWEPQARECYQDRYGVAVEQVGFITDDSGRVGVSVDGLVSDDVGVEIKCRWSSREHIKTIRDDVLPKDHWWQVQGGLWVTGRKEWHYVSYDPHMEDEFRAAFFRIVVPRCEESIAKLSHAVAKFLAVLDEEQARVEERLGLHVNIY